MGCREANCGAGLAYWLQALVPSVWRERLPQERCRQAKSQTFKAITACFLMNASSSRQRVGVLRKTEGFRGEQFWSSNGNIIGGCALFKNGGGGGRRKQNDLKRGGASVMTVMGRGGLSLPGVTQPSLPVSGRIIHQPPLGSSSCLSPFL